MCSAVAPVIRRSRGELAGGAISRFVAMKPLTEMPFDVRRRIKGVLTDIDDTLTTSGRLNADSYAALEQLQAVGLRVIPITGRPAGWCDHIARMWPVDGVVGENGAFYFRYDHDRRVMRRRYLVSDEQRAVDRRRLCALGKRIVAAVPGAALASDQHYREADLAVDFCEDVPRLSPEAVARIVELFTEAGATAKVSSIHVNGWFGEYDKLAMTKIMIRECFDVDLDREAHRFVFVGDSPNDGPLFAFLPYSVGVANVRDFASQMEALPRYVTRARSGAGFAELARMLVEARRVSTE